MYKYKYIYMLPNCRPTTIVRHTNISMNEGNRIILFSTVLFDQKLIISL